MKHYYSISLFWVLCVFGLQIVAAQPIITLTSMTPSGCTACTGGADISVSGAQPFTYIWSNNATMQDLAGICSGNYTVTVTDANGLTNTTMVSVGQVSSINLSTIITHVSCNGSNNGAINLTISGGVSPYTTLWSNGSITEDLNNLTAGTYTPTVTDATGCTKTISAVVTQPSPINPTICVTNLPCNGSCNGSKIDLTVTGGASPYSYIWGTGSTTQDLTNICAGVYTVTVTDMNGCTKTATGVVTAPAAITVSGAVTDASSGISNGSIDLTLAGGTPPYLAQWSTGSSSIDLNQLSGGTYCVTITDANNCTKTSCFTVQGNGGGPYFGPPLINGIATNSGCGTNCSGAINLTVVSISPQNTFDWMHIPGANNPQNITNVCAGSYCVTVTDTEGNTASACYTVGQGTIQHIIIESSNAAFCNFDPNNSSNVCEMVCPQSTVTYFVDPPVICGQPMNLSGATWTISGAKSYTITPGLPEVVVTWGDAGPGLIEFSSNTQQLCFESTHCVTVLEQPKAQFSTDPPTLPNVPMQLCKGQSVSFRNESLYAELYEWIFSDDLSVLNEESPSHTFKTPGNFSVTLIVRNNCLCADTLQWLVEVLDSDPPLLDCVGSVCPGETVTYTTSSGCSAYQWMVSPNGSILQGGQSGDNTITIQWSDGPVGSISLSATGCSGASCAQASIFQISIISDNAEIRGEQFVCPNSEEAYQIDLFDGTEYTWTLPTGGTILRGQGTNEVTVAWNAQIGSATHWLIVDYYNCYLECGGTDSIPVKIIPPFFIDGPVEICDQATKNYTAKTASTQLNVNCAWSVYAPDGTLSATFTGSTYSFSPTAGPGIYRLFAEPVGPGQSCSPNAEIKVSVLARPPKPVSISGPVLVCPGNPVAYQVPGNPPYEMIWTTGNGSPSSQSGNPVNVTWNSNPTHWLSVMQVSLDGLGCKSDTAQLEVQNAYHISISGPATLCEGTVGFYTADFYPGFDYQWEILPATAGIIKQGQGKNNIEVFWQTPGSHKLRVTTCGLTLDFTVTVLANPLPLPLYPEGVCPGVPGLVTITGPYTNFVWQNADGPIIGNSSSINLFPGSYVISVTDVNGCKGASEFSINKLPAPNVSVTTADPAGFCNNSIFVTLTALVPEDASFDYQWFHDGLPVGNNNVVYITNQYGLYTVIATNEYGCTASAPPLKLFEYCQGDCGGVCPFGATLCAPGTIQGVPDLTSRCDSFTMVLNDYSGLYIPGTARWWTGISGTPGWDFGVGDSVHFVYPNAGKYIVVAEVVLSNGQKCASVDSLDVEAVAQFSQIQACPGDSSFFTDESTRLPEMAIAQWNWDFGEAGNSDFSQLESPGYPYANAGSYTATLTITTASGCTSSVTGAVLVPNPPTPAFAPPTANCAGNATSFDLSNNAGIIKTDWDFGDPASGALNQSTADPAFHLYSPAGNYPVTVTATNGYGCTASVTQVVDIIPNPFSGNITPSTSVICEGSSLTLNAPVGLGATYVWNNGTILPTLSVSEEGVYDVTLTNANGCTYSPPGKAVDVNPAPIGTIKFLEINDFGQIVGVQYPQASVCAGEDVTLQIQDNGNYTYNWSGGNGNNEVLIFSEDRGNLLSVGTHTFTVTVTNTTTGCTSVLAPFTVTVNPLPENFSLSTNNVCAGLPSTISYFGPQPPEWQIVWNTGDVGPGIVTEEAGLYFVRVINEFGCSAQSNTVVIFPGPNVSALPSGCHERCNPDTLCLPSLPDIVSWQWFYEGNIIPGATSNQFAATQSGVYWATLVDVNGCEATSAPLTVALYNGFGNIVGQVWSDVNSNGVIDGLDTLVSGIPVQLLQNGVVVAPQQSDQNGGFNWSNVLSTSYTIQVDTLLISPLWEVVILTDSVQLTGCGGKVFAQLLVDGYNCPPIQSLVHLSACPGQSVSFHGTAVPAGSTQTFTLQNFQGCDSVITVSVSALPVSASTLNTSVCPGSTFTYNGVELAPGQTLDFPFTNWLGCDSIVTVSVSALPVSASTLNTSVCPGSTFTYNGVELAPGQSQDFPFTNWLGCDSIVTVSVSALPVSASTLNTSVCPGSTFTYNGVELALGQTQDFSTTNWLGCDSIVTVSVSALPVSSGAVSFGVCPNETYIFEGVVLPIGSTQNFTLKNVYGCDSVVTVTIFEKPSTTELLEVKVCPGESYTFQNQEIAPGEIKQFHWMNTEGCDSSLTISVTAWPVLDFDIEHKPSCPNLPTGSITVSDPLGLAVDFSINNTDFQTSPVFQSVEAGMYTIYVRDGHGCMVEKTTEVIQSPALEVTFTDILILPCDSQKVSLTPIISGDTTNLQMLWWNGAHTSTISTEEAGPIWIEVANQCETIRREGEVVWGDSEGNPVLVFIPNVFEPAATLTENQIFRPFFSKNLSLLSYRLEVFDRWGNFIFESEIPENGWQGKFGDTNTGTEVFVWQMWAQVSFCGRQIGIYKKGDVTVVR